MQFPIEKKSKRLWFRRQLPPLSLTIGVLRAQLIRLIVLYQVVKEAQFRSVSRVHLTQTEHRHPQKNVQNL
jgi:hypothetical protein